MMLFAFIEGCVDSNLQVEDLTVPPQGDWNIDLTMMEFLDFIFSGAKEMTYIVLTLCVLQNPKTSIDICAKYNLVNTDDTYTEADHLNLTSYGLFVRMIRPQVQGVSGVEF